MLKVTSAAFSSLLFFSFFRELYRKALHHKSKTAKALEFSSTISSRFSSLDRLDWITVEVRRKTQWQKCRQVVNCVSCSDHWPRYVQSVRFDMYSVNREQNWTGNRVNRSIKHFFFLFRSQRSRPTDLLVHSSITLGECCQAWTIWLSIRESTSVDNGSNLSSTSIQVYPLSLSL